jgi:SWI/SNF-related matrix-associated actin-dependent regulator of chromatin subfamily A member 5
VTDHLVAEPLNEEEVAEKEALVGDGFPDWQRRHFLAFIKGLERYGREALDKVALEVVDKTEEDVREYAKVFFERYTELKGESEHPVRGWQLADWRITTDAEKYMDRITAGEAKLREQADKIDALHKKVKSYNFPMQELRIQYGQNKGKSYSDEEDRFLLVRMHHHGIDRDDCYELIKRDIGEWPLFR